MTPKRRKKYKLLSLKNYLRLLYLSFKNPYVFSQTISRDEYINNAFLFYFLNLSIGLFLKALIDTIYYQKIVVIFLHITEIIIILPLSLLGILFFALTFHLLAKILMGSGKFILSLKAILYSSSPLIFYSIPLIGFLSLIWILILLIVNFHQIHTYSKLKAAVNILIPFLVIILMGSILGIFHLNLLGYLSFLS